MIRGVKTKPLRVLPDERGRLMEILRADDPVFEKFGQVYLSTTYPGIVKAWHYHKKQDDNIVAVRGMLKLVLYDARTRSATHREIDEFFIGEHNPLLVHVPKMVYHGWKCIGPEEALVINIVTEPYNYRQPDEHRLPYDSKKVPYDWAPRMG